MSGGHFGYSQYNISSIADEVEQLILTNGESEYYNYSPETIAEFKKGLDLLRRAYVYAQRIDWLASADDGEGTFHIRLQKELSEIEREVV